MEVAKNSFATGLSRISYAVALAASLAISIAVILVIFNSRSGLPYASAVFLVGFLLTLFRPRLGLGFLFLVLPIFGNRPSTNQHLYLMISLVAVFSAEVARFLIFRRTVASESTLRVPVSETIIGSLAGLYLLISVLSLTALPLHSILSDLRGSIPDFKISTLSYASLSFLRSPETSSAYSFLCVGLTALILCISGFAYRLCLGNERTAVFFLSALFAGLIFSLTVGLLDYYTVIDLRWWRQLDPIVNPDNRQFRLQSLFGHSGWYAEYVTLLIPLSMVLLLLPVRFAYRVLIILGILLLGEYALILTFQRGGWLSYPLTLVGVWIAIYVTARLEKGERNILPAIRGSVLKVAISIPITLLLTVGLIAIINENSSGKGPNSIRCYIHRVQEIGNTSDRTIFFKAGFLIGSLHPFFGAGSDSFAMQYEREFLAPNGNFFEQVKLPMHGTAHNVYMQTFSGKGIAGLLALLLLAVIPITQALRCILHSDECSQRAKILLLSGVSFLVAFIIYGNVQEIFYLQVLQVLFFVVLFIMAALMPRAGATYTRIVTWSSYIAAVLFLAHLSWELIWPGRLAAELSTPQEFGCYSTEVTPPGGKFEWCNTNALKLIPTRGERSIKFTVYAHAFTAGSSLTVALAEPGLSTEKKVIQLSEKPTEIEFEIPKEFQKKSWIAVNLRSDKYFIPIRDMGPSAPDPRVLSFYFRYSNWPTAAEMATISRGRAENENAPPKIRPDIERGAGPVGIADPCKDL